MTSPKETLTPLETIKKTHENFVIFLGVAVGVILLGYFFTFAMLTDKGSSGLLWFEGISSLLMVAVLIKIKWLAFQLTRILLSRNTKVYSTLKSMSSSDL